MKKQSLILSLLLGLSFALVNTQASEARGFSLRTTFGSPYYSPYYANRGYYGGTGYYPTGVYYGSPVNGCAGNGYFYSGTEVYYGNGYHAAYPAVYGSGYAQSPSGVSFGVGF